MTRSDGVIQQTLHGYHEGHRLLAASTTLPAETEQIMSVLSDLSGQGIVRHFEVYITGYGLPELGAYALAKTWYAPEMTRPGCVWTHTLLIPFGLLGNTQSLHGFVRLFKRPVLDNYREYGVPCGLAGLDSQKNHPNVVANVAMQSREVIYRLYDNPDSTVVVPIDSPKMVEPIFLEIWSQQWPRLRRHFTFCTGAISGRRIDGRWFDLLGVPVSRFDEVHRTIKNSVVAELESRLSVDERKSWLKVVVGDLESAPMALRKFLFEFGAEAENGRPDFVPMTNLFLALDDRADRSVGKVISSLRAVFPRANMGTKLKRRLLAGEVGPDVLRTPSVPLQLILLSEGELFDTSAAQVRSIALRSWAHDPGGVIATLDSMMQQNAPLNDMTMATLAETLEPDQVTRLGTWSVALGKLASYRPMILTHEVFVGMEGRNRALLEYLSSPRATQEEVNAILHQWLREREFGQVEAASGHRPNAIVPEVLNLMIAPMEQEDREFPTDLLIRLCRRFPEKVTKWLKRNIPELGHRPVERMVMGCIVVGVEYKQIPITKANIDAWERFLSCPAKLDLVLWEAAVMQLFLRAMQLRSAYAARVATATFPYIFRRLRDSQISYEEWYTLQEILIGFGWDWNRCRRLTEGLIDHFREFEWPRKYFVDMMKKDAELAREICNMKFYRVRYDRFVKRSAKQIPRASWEG